MAKSSYSTIKHRIANFENFSSLQLDPSNQRSDVVPRLTQACRALDCFAVVKRGLHERSGQGWRQRRLVLDLSREGEAGVTASGKAGLTASEEASVTGGGRQA